MEKRLLGKVKVWYGERGALYSRPAFTEEQEPTEIKIYTESPDNVKFDSIIPFEVEVFEGDTLEFEYIMNIDSIDSENSIFVDFAIDTVTVLSKLFFRVIRYFSKGASR